MRSKVPLDPINKGELASLVAEEVDLTQAQGKEVVDAVISIITKALKKKRSVSIVGFGTFSVVRRKERLGRNPQTGAQIKIKAANKPKFKPGKVLQDAVQK